MAPLSHSLLLIIMHLLFPSSPASPSSIPLHEQTPWSSDPNVIRVNSPAPGSTLTTSETGSPLTAPLSVSISIPEGDFDPFVSSHDVPPDGLSVLFELSSLKSSEEFELVSRVGLDRFETTLEGELSKLIPGRRVMRATVVSSSGLVFASSLSSFVVRDAGSGSVVGADVDITDYTPTTSSSASYDAYFSQVYRYKIWSAQGALGSSSGPGSNMEATSGARGLLLSLVRSGAVKRIIDVPCGDMTWMSSLLPVLSSQGVSYLGLDVVPSVIAENTARHASQNVSFAQHDLTRDPLPPTGPGDIILCRHLMFHLPPSANLAVLSSLRSSSADLVLMTTYLKADDNDREYVLAMGHHVNLFREPYCLKGPRTLVQDGNDEDMYLGMWGRGEMDAGECLQ